MRRLAFASARTLPNASDIICAIARQIGRSADTIETGRLQHAHWLAPKRASRRAAYRLAHRALKTADIGP